MVLEFHIGDTGVTPIWYGAGTLVVAFLAFVGFNSQT